MSYSSNLKDNFMMYLGLGFSLVGIVLYDPLGLLFQGTGLMIIGVGLVCMYVSYKHSGEVEAVKKPLKTSKKDRRK